MILGKQNNWKRPSWLLLALLVVCVVLSVAFQVVKASEEGEEDSGEGVHNDTNSTDEENENGGGHHEEEEEEVEPSTAILFPWFAQAVGIVVFCVLTRFLTQLPYTAIMFLVGMIKGLAGSGRIAVADADAGIATHDLLTESISLWDGIDHEVLLLVFLPALIFSDAVSLNLHLFQASISQTMTFAFPMVLAGTVLTACVAFYILPYNWSWNLCMTIGSILSATDPVAVSALLNEVGAPPRLKTHISGESLLNDGSAIVFFTIFSGLYLKEMEVEGVGRNVDVGTGFALFFRMSVGGALIGTAFGLGLTTVLYFLNRRLNREENIVQVTATITVAYLTYFVAEIVAGTSGVIATVACGVTTKAWGWSFLNDRELMESFWSLVEHLFNTLLFTLGGVVWGTILSNPDSRPDTQFEARDWGYLFVLYGFLTAIRFGLVGAFYPLVSRMGLSTNWKEAVFMSFGGLRGAVGIALAIALDNEVWSSTEGSRFRAETNTLFGMVGGIAFLTLFVNGTLSGPLLRRLGLAHSTVARDKIVAAYHKKLATKVEDTLMHKLTDPRFRLVDYGFVKVHVPFLEGLNVERVMLALERRKETTPPTEQRVKPDLTNVLNYLRNKGDVGHEHDNWKPEETTAVYNEDALPASPLAYFDDCVHTASKRSEKLGLVVPSGTEATTTDTTTPPDINELKELRQVFLAILQANYQEQLRQGELETRDGFVSFVLLESLEFARDEVANQSLPLHDWDSLQKLRRTWVDRADRISMRFLTCNSALFVARQQRRIDVHLALAVIEAHLYAQDKFCEEFCGEHTEAANESQAHIFGEHVFPTASYGTVLQESKAVVQKAVASLKAFDADEVVNIVSHLLCIQLLNRATEFVYQFQKYGLMTEKEATAILEEVEESLNHIYACTKEVHD